MLKHKITTIIFDIDGTLTDYLSWMKMTEDLGASGPAAKKVFDEMRAEKLSYERARDEIVKLWRERGNANKKFMKKMFESWELKPGAREVLDYLKKKYRLCLMSGSVDLYAQTVAEKLGIKDWYANTTLVWDKDGNLVTFHYHVDQAKKKLEQFEEFASKYNIRKDECLVIGDNDSDLRLFQELKYVIAMKNPDYKGLEKLAYKTISELKELKEIL